MFLIFIYSILDVQKHKKYTYMCHLRQVNSSVLFYRTFHLFLTLEFSLMFCSVLTDIIQSLITHHSQFSESLQSDQLSLVASLLYTVY